MYNCTNFIIKIIDFILRYMHGEGVNGALAVSVHSDSYSSQTVLSYTQLSEGHSCYNHTVRTSPLGFGRGNEEPTMVIADIAFQVRELKKIMPFLFLFLRRRGLPCFTLFL